MPIRPLLVATAALASIPAAHAQTAPDDRDAPVPPDIIVTAPLPQSEADVLSGTSVVSGAELTRSIKPTIGETLAHQPGVTASSFGPNASRPILRGFQGDRVRVLTDGIGAIDVSNTSADHATIINPLLAERVEVLRGPSALLFGSSAVGGVVNVVDTRIPRSVPSDGARLKGIATYGSAADERSVAGAGDVGVGEHLVLHADGSYLKTGDLHIGGHALSPEARARALASGSADIAASAAIEGTLPNSAAETWTTGLGAAWITDGGDLGLSYSHYDSLYGIPIRYALAPGEEQEAPRLDVVQNRLDLRAEIDAGGALLDKIRLRAATAHYRHYELEEDGAIGTAFYNDGIEARLELAQAKHGGWQGASGVQYFARDFDVEGEEAFLPRNATEQLGLFTLQQLEAGPIKAEAGLRYETSAVDSKVAAGDARFPSAERRFDALSGSVGASYGVTDDWRIGLNASRTERSPTAEELFANGPHAGTAAYVLGNPDFTTEKSRGLEATLHGHGDGYSLDVSAYTTWFADYIYDAQVAQGVCEAAAAPSGREVDLPCFQTRQADARYAGFEIDGSAMLARIGGVTINADALADYVRATILDERPAPRIPPLRLLGGIEAQGDVVDGRVEVEHVFDQRRTAAFETPTPGYTMVNASLSLTPFAGNTTALVLSANNLFDIDARRASSFLKDFAPLAGRDVRATLRFSI